MPLPNFLIIGSQKSGTTSLYHVLRHHPQIFMPERKEINYFFHQAEYDKGFKHYISHFDHAPENSVAIGEASPGYICHPLSPGRIHRLLPQVKLILTVRHPIERAYSQYWDNRRSLSEPRTFEQTIETALEATYHPERLGYFSRGTYIQYINRYLECFPRENLLVLSFEDLRRSPEDFYCRIFTFLGVDVDVHIPDITAHRNPAAIWQNPIYKTFLRYPALTRLLHPRFRRFTFFGKRTPWQYPPMKERTRRRLIDFYQPWNAALATFLGQDLSHWDQ